MARGKKIDSRRVEWIRKAAAKPCAPRKRTEHLRAVAEKHGVSMSTLYRLIPQEAA